MDAIRKQPNRLVHEGLDGWLFLAGGENVVEGQPDLVAARLSIEAEAEWGRVLAARAERASARQIRLAHIVIPDKLSVYGAFAPSLQIASANASARRIERQARSVAGLLWIDLLGAMEAQRNNELLFWKTDTHWTPEGCLLAYAEICRTLELRPCSDLRQRDRNQASEFLDLGGKLSPPVAEAIEAYHFLQEARRTRANLIARLSDDPAMADLAHIGAHIRYENPTARNATRMMVFGDSFSGLGPNMLSAALAETVQRLDFIWSSNIDWKLVDRVRPQIVLVETAERFLWTPPRDDVDIRFSFPRSSRKIFSRWIAGAMAAGSWRMRMTSENSA